jgi:hypothetical protein
VGAQYAIDLALPWVLILDLKPGAEVGEFDFSNPGIAFEFLEFDHPTAGLEFFAQSRADLIQSIAARWAWTEFEDFSCQGMSVISEIAIVVGLSKKPKRYNRGGKNESLEKVF